MFIINPNIEIINNQNSFLILKINENIIKISEIEYNILTFYTENKNNLKDVINKFKSILNIKEEVLNLLIQKSIENKILIKESHNNKLNFCNIIVKFPFKKNENTFELIILNFTRTKLNDFFTKSYFFKFIITILISINIFFILDLFSSSFNFKESYIKTLYKVPYQFSYLIFFIYLSSFCSVIFHELGHFISYKLIKGKESILGFGLMFFIFPTFFNKIFTNKLIKKQEKILVFSSGIIFDYFLFIFLLYFAKYYNESFPILTFFAYILMFSISIRTLFNANIFLPKSDGFHIFSTILNQIDLFKTSIYKFIQIKNKKENLNIKNIFYMIYLFLCIISIIISYLMFFSPLFFYFYYSL